MVVSIRQLFKGYYKYCECGCRYLISIINKMGEFARFRKGHNNRGENNYNYGKTGNLHPKWKGGKSNHYEYIVIYKPYYKYSNKVGYVREHRYIMYIYLSILNTKPTYIEGFDVHHKNENKKDNRIENLQLLTPSEHTIGHKKNAYILSS